MVRPMSGSRPPNTPLPMWYGSDIDVYRTFAGNASTRYAAIGPYTRHTKHTCTNTRKISATTFGFGADPWNGVRTPSTSVWGSSLYSLVTGFCVEETPTMLFPAAICMSL